MTITRRGLLATERRTTRSVVQHLNVDEFGELAARKRAARKTADTHGHDLGAWHRRPNDPYGRWNAFCHTCNMIAVVAVEAPDHFAEPIYGRALDHTCTRSQS